MLDQLRTLITRRRTDHNLQSHEAGGLSEASSTAVEAPRETSSTVVEAPALAFVASLPAGEQSAEEQTVAQADRGVVPGMSSCRPSPLYVLAKRRHNRLFPSAFYFIFSRLVPALSMGNDRPPNTGNILPVNVSFANLPVNDVPESQDPDTSENTLARDLFGGIQTSQVTFLWNPLILQSIEAKSRNGLSDDVRTGLLVKYEVKEDVAVLAPPKLNREFVSVLTPAVIKRDEYQALAQAQVAACLNAFGSGMSSFLKPEILQALSEEAKSALTFFSEGMHLLADHHFRLSLTRRAFTKPSMNVIGKSAADTAPIDDFLFGQNFAETLKAAQACEKAGRDVVKATSFPGKKTAQPIRQQAPPRRDQPLISRRSGNQKAPSESSIILGSPNRGSVSQEPTSSFPVPISRHHH